MIKYDLRFFVFIFYNASFVTGSLFSRIINLNKALFCKVLKIVKKFSLNSKEIQYSTVKIMILSRYRYVTVPLPSHYGSHNDVMIMDYG
jgi:hypothetical protein